MALFRRSSSDAHWSKDYIEHLRSVHFVLIAVAVTCIAVSRGPDIGQLENAQVQVHQLLDVAKQEEPESKHKFVTISVKNKLYFSELETAPSLVQFCDKMSNAVNGWEFFLSGWSFNLTNADNLERFIHYWNVFNCP